MGSAIIPGAVEALSFLQSLGKRLIFVTNNAFRSRQTYVDHFAKLGLSVTKVGLAPCLHWTCCSMAPCQEAIYSAGYTTLVYVKERLKIPVDRKIYAVTWPGFAEEFTEMGYQVIIQSV